MPYTKAGIHWHTHHLEQRLTWTAVPVFAEHAAA